MLTLSEVQKTVMLLHTVQMISYWNDILVAHCITSLICKLRYVFPAGTSKRKTSTSEDIFRTGMFTKDSLNRIKFTL